MDKYEEMDVHPEDIEDSSSFELTGHPMDIGPAVSEKKKQMLNMRKHPRDSMEVKNGIDAYIESGRNTPSRIGKMVGKLLQYYVLSTDVVIAISREELADGLNIENISVPAIIHTEFKEWLLTLGIDALNEVVANLGSDNRNAKIFTYYYWVHILGTIKDFPQISRNVSLVLVPSPISATRIEKVGLFDHSTLMTKMQKAPEGYDHLKKDEFVQMILELGGAKMQEYYKFILKLLESGERFKVSQELINRVRAGKRPKPGIAIPRNLEDILVNDLGLKTNGEFDAFMLIFWTIAGLLVGEEIEVFQEPEHNKAREYSHRYVSTMRWKDEEMLDMRAARILKEMFDEQ